jgi:hypothetical protein
MRLQHEETCKLLYKSKLAQPWKPWKVNIPIIIAIDYEQLRPLAKYTIVTIAYGTMDMNEPEN